MTGLQGMQPWGMDHRLSFSIRCFHPLGSIPATPPKIGGGGSRMAEPAMRTGSQPVLQSASRQPLLLQLCLLLLHLRPGMLSQTLPAGRFLLR